MVPPAALVEVDPDTVVVVTPGRVVPGPDDVDVVVWAEQAATTRASTTKVERRRTMTVRVSAGQG